MLKKIVFGICLPLAILGAAALSFSGCGKSAPASDSAGKMKVVATTTMLTDLARQIGGDKVEVSGLMKAGVDPHLYQAGAGDVDAMNKADIVVYNGVHLEGKMGAIFDNLHAQKKPTIRVSDGIPSETLLDFEEDGEKTKDPHIWFSVKNWKDAAKEVAKGFSEKDPKNKSYYEDHLNAYLAELDNLDKYMGKTVRFKGYVCQTPRVPKGCFVPGRFGMTCCAEDISFIGFICAAENAAALQHRSWVTVTATVGAKEHPIYDGVGPWLEAASVTPAQPPKEELVYFLR